VTQQVLADTRARLRTAEAEVVEAHQQRDRAAVEVGKLRNDLDRVRGQLHDMVRKIRSNHA
jgi:Tfp pilus assembly protein PilO